MAENTCKINKTYVCHNNNKRTVLLRMTMMMTVRIFETLIKWKIKNKNKKKK